MRTPQAVLLLAFLGAGCGHLRGPDSPAPAPPAAVPGARARLHGVDETPRFRRAVEQGTRTRSGRPGDRYWSQHAEYRLRAEIDPAARRLSGSGTIRYHNASPDTLRQVAVHLYPNLFEPTAARNVAAPATGGVTLSRVVAQGQPLPLPDDSGDPRAPRYVSGTLAWIRLPRPLPPGSAADLELAWSFTVPPDGAPRTGTDGEVYFLAYWYPQVAVYDDVSGWHTDRYLGAAEFYMDYGDYDVEVTVPAGWLVTGTGTLQNPGEVLAPRTLARLASVRGSAEVVRVVAQEERGTATRSGRQGRLTWRFRARGVRDFSWAASGAYLWDATYASSGGDTAAVHAFYRPERRAWAWDQAARYARHSVEFYSRYLWPYPYPHMTVVDGPASCNGMEYPMMACIGGRRDTLSLYSVASHEISHMWFPMQVGSDEKRHAWQDEGLARFNQSQAMRDFFAGYDFEGVSRDRYLGVARAENETALMRHGDLYPPGGLAYMTASYEKASVAMGMLRDLLGEEEFLRAYREYGRRWIGRHPQPYDFWNTFEDVTGKDLSWFWRTWYFETWTLDQALSGVHARGAWTEIEVENRGRAPMPARLAVTRADGSVERVEVPVEVWLDGASRHVVRVRSAPAISRVEIDPEGAFPDVDRSNQRWTADAGAR